MTSLSITTLRLEMQGLPFSITVLAITVAPPWEISAEMSSQSLTLAPMSREKMADYFISDLPRIAPHPCWVKNDDFPTGFEFYLFAARASCRFPSFGIAKKDNLCLSPSCSSGALQSNNRSE